ncbi:Carboxypeptidase [Mycena indigotica]|uniref:Carboxypeptidase n=1 Tax=Mycena indigotica TaxID=2126181 RepID=A0A8H6WFX2_9AGAR|nr:Carboxypeptidase [Mycena indigotica]KAF7315211.1 Carboxypeptidase [Mycena indigotica]
MFLIHAFAFGVAAAAAFQAPFESPQQYDSGLFVPFESLSLLSESKFTTLGHPAFPNHSVRIKKSSFCDPTVQGYTGYIDIQARHLFFYFFESRNDPTTDDLIFWTNGGPGCSSSVGLLMELGPCRVSDSNTTTFHPESWTSSASVFFVDQPIGVGFSYADYGETVGTTEDAAKDIAAFMFIFFEHFTQFKGRALHMAGESYGGRYVPVFAAEVYDQNAQLVKAGYTPINLQSVMIGNGLTDYLHQIASSFDMQCTSASVPAFTDIATCVQMKKIIPRCLDRAKSACEDHFDTIDCQAAMTFCATYLEEPFAATGLNPYDVSQKCEGELRESLCYPIIKDITAYLDRPHVRAVLGVDPSLTSNFSTCSYGVGSAFERNLDHLKSTQYYVAALLERNVRVLIYVGTYDWICNWKGNERWTLAMEWSGQEEFVQQGLRPWGFKGQNNRIGLVRNAKGLTFATIEGAGHMVPYDKPKEALEMVQRWLAGKAL